MSRIGSQPSDTGLCSRKPFLTSLQKAVTTKVTKGHEGNALHFIYSPSCASCPLWLLRCKNCNHEGHKGNALHFYLFAFVRFVSFVVASLQKNHEGHKGNALHFYLFTFVCFVSFVVASLQKNHEGHKGTRRKCGSFSPSCDSCPLWLLRCKNCNHEGHKGTRRKCASFYLFTFVRFVSFVVKPFCSELILVQMTAHSYKYTRPFSGSAGVASARAPLAGERTARCSPTPCPSPIQGEGCYVPPPPAPSLMKGEGSDGPPPPAPPPRGGGAPWSPTPNPSPTRGRGAMVPHPQPFPHEGGGGSVPPLPAWERGTGG